jgi:hypothetical protein
MDETEDPAARFADPDEIARHPELSPERKRALLERWRQNLARQGQRDLGEQGQEGPAANLWERIGRALEFLDTESGGREQTHERVLHGPGMAPDATPGRTGGER